jgi:hypothetical protein
MKLKVEIIEINRNSDFDFDFRIGIPPSNRNRNFDNFRSKTSFNPEKTLPIFNFLCEIS